MIETSRLLLRPWTKADLPELVRVINTPAVMQYLGGVQSPEATQAAFHRACMSQSLNGFCFWLVERRADQSLLGECGLEIARSGSVAGEVGIGWRLREDAWGHGYAREAAAACLDWAWHNLSCARIVASTSPGNSRNINLLEWLGLHRETELDFDHSDYSSGDSMRARLVYTIARPGLPQQTCYIVQCYSTGDNVGLEALPTIACQTPEAAKILAERLAPTKAGVVAYSAAGDSNICNLDDQTIIFHAGQLPAYFEGKTANVTELGASQRDGTAGSPKTAIC